MDKEKAAQQIADKLQKARELIDACVKISEESGVGFDLPWGGEGSAESGMGAYYSPKDDPHAEWNRNYGSEDIPGWQPSAQSC